MKKNKLILFDWGGVVEPQEEGSISAFKELFSKFGYINDDIISKLKKYKLSSISTIDEYKKTFEEMKKDFNVTCTFNEYLNLYKEIFDRVNYHKEVADYEVSLNDKCYIGILSNLSIIDNDRIDKQLGLNNYDFVFLSYEFGCQKPDRKIYEEIMKKLPFDGKDILFIDDLEKNVLVPKELGWNTFVASGNELEKIKQACEEFINN